MGAPVPEFEAVEDASVETLLSSLKSISASERRRHASVFNYWLTIRGDKQLPPIRDLDPLEISDAGPCSVLLEMIGGEDADIRHLGQAIKLGIQVEKVSEAPNPSLLSCIATRLPIVAATKQPFAFEEEFTADDDTTRCWVTLLPFSASGSLIDYVYGFVSLEPPPGAVEEAPEAEPVEDQAPEPEAESVEQTVEEPLAPVEQAHGPLEEPLEQTSDPEDSPPEQVVDALPEAEEHAAAPEPDPAAVETPAPSSGPGFSAKLIASLEAVRGFYGTSVDVEPNLATAPVAEKVPEKSSSKVEGSLQIKLDEVRAKAEEARAAKLRANAALYEGLSAAYDFALDAEDSPEEYLKIVQAQGLKIQLRSPMTPVVKLAFDGMCDEATIGQLEAILSWALEQELPRGSLAERIESAGGIGPFLNGRAEAA